MHTLLLLSVLWQGTSTEALQHVQAGTAAHRQGQLAVAIDEFRKAAAADPNLADAFVNLGEALMENRDYRAAIAPLKRALELNPDLPSGDELLGFALLTLGYSDEAIPHLKKAKALGGVGIAEMDTGDLGEAIANLRAALSARPNDPDLLYYLGRASGLLSKQSMDVLLANHPDSARAHQALAENYFVLRQMPQAEKEYLEALRLRPDLPSVHLELGLVYAATGEWTKAEQEYRSETKFRPGSAEASYRLGTALLQQGKAKAAHEELKRANDLKPDMPETLYSLGKAASLNGDPAGAENSWKRVLQLEGPSPLAAQTHFALAKLYRQQGKNAEANREMSEFQKLQSSSSLP